MENIKLARIDDRLIHGQVMTNWLHYVSAQQIVIVDDQTANDPYTSRVLQMAVPKSIRLRILTVTDSIEYLKKGVDVPTILLTKTPKSYLKLIVGGVNLPEIIIGGMGASSTRKKLYKNISISKKEVADLKTILDLEVPITIKVIPNDKGIIVTRQLLDKVSL